MSVDKPKRILFLFGAGISMASAWKANASASTSELTEAVFEEKLYSPYDGRFCRPLQNESTSITTDGVHPLLRLIKSKFIKHPILKENKVTYEDLMFFLINTAHEYGYPKDPLLSSTLIGFSKEASMVWIAKNNMRDYEFLDMLYLAHDYIKCVIQLRLYELNNKEHVGFNWVGKALRDDSLQSHIVTLNHDTLLERYLRNENIQFIDGFFADEEQNIRLFDTRTYLDDSVRHLVKLHGSIDWKAYGGTENYVVGIPQDGFKEHQFLDKGTPTEDPVILSGTHNKLEGYSYGIYSDLLTEYVRLLWRTNRVVICGYGFLDRGINSRLANWLRLDKNNQITVIHQDGDEFVRRFGKKLHPYHPFELLEVIDKSRIKWIKSSFQETDWLEVRDNVLNN